MKYNCIIVDDEQTARNILKKYIQDVPSLKLENEFKNAIDALEYIQNHNIDLIFLDIEMPKLSGISLAKIIENKTKVIFTTAHREFALEGYELNVVDYLLKPFSFDRFLKAVQRVVKRETQNTETLINDFIYVKVNKKMMKINFSELLYIEGLSNYIKIHTKNETLVVYDKLSVLANRLSSNSFMRIHKSYIINLKKVKLYTREYVEISNKHIPISSTYRAGLLSFLKS